MPVQASADLVAVHAHYRLAVETREADRKKVSKVRITVSDMPFSSALNLAICLHVVSLTPPGRERMLSFQDVAVREAGWSAQSGWSGSAIC